MRIILADNQRKRGDELRRILLGEGLTCDAEDLVDYRGLVGRLTGMKSDLVLVSINGSSEEALAAIRAAHQITEVPILAAGQPATVEAVREAMRAGAREFLDLSRLRAELPEAIIKLGVDSGSGQRGEVISLFSPSGGVGVSTMSINLAVRFADSTDGEVALVDLKPAPSDLALLLDLEPKHTLDDICLQSERMDRRMLRGTLSAHSSGLWVLSQAGYPDGGGILQNTLTDQTVGRLLTLMRRIYSVSIVDLAHTLSPPQIEAMRLSTFVGLIVRPDVPGLHRARWALDTIAKMGLRRERFKLVLNRCGGRDQIDAARVEEILGIEVFQQIPEDRRVVSRAVNRGVPVVELSKMSRLSRSFSSFARSVQACVGKVTT